MSWRTIIITKPAKISLSNNNLLYSPSDDEQISVALDEISVIIIESPQVLITSMLLSTLAQHNIALFSCNASHLPNGIFLPYHRHSRFATMMYMQIQWTQAFKKRIWQCIIKSKITNQALTLKRIGKISAYQTLMHIAKNVQSGDSTFRESVAAKYYFDNIFDNFKRRNATDWRVNALDYGYSIIRGLIARHISASGLSPALGVHHHSGLNAFNLADDLIEPYRPLVDYHIYTLAIKYNIHTSSEFNTEHKHKLLEILQTTVVVNHDKSLLIGSAELIIHSLMRATKTRNYKELQLVSFND